jgi:hypothetical protein
MSKTTARRVIGLSSVQLATLRTKVDARPWMLEISVVIAGVRPTRATRR